MGGRASRRRLDPGDVADAASVGAVLAAGLDVRPERLGDVVGQDHREAVRRDVGACRAQGGDQIVLAGHVHDCIMDHDDVEGRAEPHRAHVGLDVGGARIEGAADREHGRRDVDQGQGQIAPEMRGRVAAARAELEQARGPVPERGVEHAEQPLGFLLVAIGRREQRPPGRQVGIEARHSAAMLQWRS